MQTDLKGKKVLVTRPAELAENLCKLIEDNNGFAVRFPVLEIHPPENSEVIKDKLVAISNFDIGIFISRNAVLKTLEHPSLNMSQLKKLKLFAVGASTAEQLSESGIKNVEYVNGVSGSESLLQSNGLMAEFVKNKKVIIFRGQGGREYLASVLLERGAQVEYIEVYKRVCPSYDKADIDKVWANGGPEFIIVTSTEALDNLIILLGSEQRKFILNKQILTIGARIANQAEKLGFTKQAIVATHANDKGMIEALLSATNM